MPKTFFQPGMLEALVTEADLTSRSTFYVIWSYEYTDDDALIRAMVSAGGLPLTAGPEHEHPLGDSGRRVTPAADPSQLSHAADAASS